jgi:hypothetical protein
MIFKEIGSNFYTDKIFYCDTIKDNIIKEKYKKANVIYPSLGRNAISIILKELKINNGKALLPGYTCDSVIKPFITENFKIEFYNFQTNLDINIEDFKNKIAKIQPDIILVHGFYGVNTFLTADTEIQKSRKNGSIIIQDDTQTVFSDQNKIEADYYIGSLRKWLEIPDGAFICCSHKISLTTVSENRIFVSKVSEAFKIKLQYVETLDTELKLKYKKLFLEAQELIDQDLSNYQMSEIAKGTLNNYDLSSMIIKRKQNFRYLYNNLFRNYAEIKPVFDAPLEENICPIYFPIYVKRRMEFQRYLSDRDVYATIIWPKSGLIGKLKNETDYIYNNIIGIPCDQRYNLSDMQRVIEVIKLFING